MKIWVTGIAGFLGSHIAEALIAQGHEVWGNDSLVCGDRDNVPRYADGTYPCAWRDCRNGLEAQFKAFKPEAIIHTAATASEGFSVFSPSFITRNIYEASVATFSAAISAGVKRIVNFSSMARYGHGYSFDRMFYGPPFKEDYQTNPVDPYGIAKVAAERTLEVLCNTHGVKWTTLVPHNVIGTRQEITPYRNVVSIFLNRLKLGLPVYIYGDGTQRRCFSPVADCLPSILRAVNGEADSEVVNIGPDSGEITINNLLSLCEKVTGVVAERIYLPPRPVTDNVKDAFCSSDKARRLLGYKEQQSLEDCIREMSEAMVPKPFTYGFPIEIDSDKVPRTWREKL